MRFVVLLCGLLLTACSPSLSQDTPQPTAQNIEITQQLTNPNAIGPVDFPDDVNPLTGQTVADPALLDRRPVIVKVSNAPPLVRPQSGIGEADIVYEHYTEGSLTRFSAVFLTNAPQRVGSIRSARIIDYEIVSMYAGILAFSGASIGVEKVIYGWEDVENRIPGSQHVAPHVPLPPSPFAERAYKGVLYGLPYFWRDESIPVPHNMFTNVAAMWELAEADGHAQRPDLTGMAFHPDPPENSTNTANTVEVRYRTTLVNWTYDAESGLYRRSADGMGHFDSNTEQQITASNVVVIYADHFNTDIVESQYNDQIAYSIEMTIQGEGDAVLFRDGQRYDGRWVRDGLFDRLSLRTTDGNLLYFKPGNTWFQIFPLPEQQNPNVEWVRVLD